MRKKDLKSGMAIVTNCGGVYLIVGNLAVRNGSYMDIETHNEDLTYSAYRDLDIVEIYECEREALMIRLDIEDKKTWKRIWKREEKTVVTLQEIANKFGVDVSELRIKE